LREQEEEKEQKEKLLKVLQREKELAEKRLREQQKDDKKWELTDSDDVEKPEDTREEENNKDNPLTEEPKYGRIEDDVPKEMSTESEVLHLEEWFTIDSDASQKQREGTRNLPKGQCEQGNAISCGEIWHQNPRASHTASQICFSNCLRDSSCYSDKHQQIVRKRKVPSRLFEVAGTIHAYQIRDDASPR
jgi:hypothetical protein